MFDRNPTFDLDMKYVNKFGYNEYGKSAGTSYLKRISVPKSQKLFVSVMLKKPLRLLDSRNSGVVLIGI